MNTYGYAYQSPLNYTDPNGETPVNAAAAAGGAAFGGAMGFFGSLTSQFNKCGNGFDDVDWSDVLWSTGIGAAAGAYTGATFGLGGASVQMGAGFTAGMGIGGIGGMMQNASNAGDDNDCECN
ncbi:MAG: hypothetical protein JAY85_20110 [Candidatus Thiodiazotropha weberae]|nr:hypothetical protein [Candidatus Thiodiazotropha weberae]